MSNVVEFVIRDKYPKVDNSEDGYEDEDDGSHSYVLDACDEVFEWGAVVLALAEDGSVELSSSVEDEEVVVDMLVSAALSIQKRLEDAKA
jgi:uncharacterized protein (DUF169 family)